MCNYCNNESFLDIETYYSGFMIRYGRQRPSFDQVPLQIDPSHVDQQNSKPSYDFVKIALRVTFRPNLSPTCVYQPDDSNLWAQKWEALGPPLPQEPMCTDLPCQQSWNLGFVQQSPATLSERIHVTICKGCRLRSKTKASQEELSGQLSY